MKKRECVFSAKVCKGADQELAEIAILVLERSGATIVLK
jgi:hypothetical protein